MSNQTFIIKTWSITDQLSWADATYLNGCGLKFKAQYQTSQVGTSSGQFDYSTGTDIVVTTMNETEESQFLLRFSGRAYLKSQVHAASAYYRFDA